MKLLKDSLIYLLGELAAKALPFLLLPYLTRKFGAAGYGDLSYWQTLLSLLVIVFSLSQDGALTRYFYVYGKRNLPGVMLAGYGYTDSRIRKFSFSPERLIEDGFMDKGTQVQDGMRQAGIPMNTFYLAAGYTFTRGPLQGLGLNATANYMDNVYRDLNKTLIYGAYWDTDLGIAYRLKNGIRLQVNINNVLDDRTFTQSLGTQITPRTPRSYLFTIGYSL